VDDHSQPLLISTLRLPIFFRTTTSYSFHCSELSPLTPTDMPRVPVHREPKPPPRNRSREHENRRYSHGHDQRSTGHANRRSNNHGRPKHTISTLTAHLVAAVGEFVGTFMFLYFAFAGQIMIVTQTSDVSRSNGLASSQQNIFTALLYGFSLLVNVWAFYRISGGLFNPAVRT
jgi:aquaporin related protein